MFQQYIQQYDNRYVEWFVDANNGLNLYILSDKGFGYSFSCKSNNIPENIKALISKNGEFLGFNNKMEFESNNKINYQNIKKENNIIYKYQGA